MMNPASEWDRDLHATWPAPIPAAPCHVYQQLSCGRTVLMHRDRTVNALPVHRSRIEAPRSRRFPESVTRSNVLEFGSPVGGLRSEIRKGPGGIAAGRGTEDQTGRSMRDQPMALPGAGAPAAGSPGRHASERFAGRPASGSGSGYWLGAGHAAGQPARWLAVSMLALGVLAAASATVSYAAQYQMVFAAKAVAPVAALEAAIPDVAALIFATLGVALALHGRRAIRARSLNAAAVATSITMNVLAAGHGWRDLAVWAMPPVAYALASDTAITVVRAWAVARQLTINAALADDETTPLAIAGRLLLWLMRLVLAPASTLAGFRSWVLDECPVAPGRSAARTQRGAITPAPRRAITPRAAPRQPRQGSRTGTKTARFLALAAERYGPLAAFPLADVSRVCAELAPEADLNPGAARNALRRHVQSLQNGSAP